MPRQEPKQEGDVLLGFAYGSVHPPSEHISIYIQDKKPEDGKPKDVEPSFLNYLKIPGLSLYPFANTFLYLLKERPKPEWALEMWEIANGNERGMPHDAHKISPTHFCAVFGRIEGSSPGLVFNPDLNYQPHRSADIKNRNLVTFFYRQPAKTTTEAEQATTATEQTMTATEKTTTKTEKTSRFSKLKSMITKNENTPTTVSGTQNIPVIVSKTKNIPVMEFPISLAQKWQAYAACTPVRFLESFRKKSDWTGWNWFTDAS
ncbi:hypothetical protein C8R42DRAFT_679364 [Lentinula raphanica]|nr:hypothetical protein C8R42DRAFT_679364 [Lentinula raphanica]